MTHAALRYAAMVRTMTLGRLAEVYEGHLERHPHPDGRDLDARERLSEWLADADELALATDVTIVLVSADFGPEITGTVLWLNEHGLDIRCVRMAPYRLEGKLLLDVQQGIPLPEATDYQVRIRAKQAMAQPTRGSTSWNHDLTKYVITDASGSTSHPLAKRQAVLRMAHALVATGVPVSDVVAALPVAEVRRLEQPLADSEVAGALLSAHPSIHTRRWFTEAPLRGDGALFVITKMFGSDTEGVLNDLAVVAPHTGVSSTAHAAD